MMGPHHAAAAFFFDQAEEEELPSFMQGKARISEEVSGENESGEFYVIEMAVPGVQAHHITIEENNGELEIVAIRLGEGEEVVKTYQDVLFLHPSKADLSKLVATIKDGILTVRVPKIVRKVLIIETESAPAPAAQSKNQRDDAMEQEEEKNTADFRVSWDLPGVSTANIVVEVHNDRDEDQLQVTAKRERGGNVTTTVHRSMTVPPSIDMEQAHAYLQNGVFTLLAPRRGQEAGAQENGVRIYYATPEDDTVLQEVASLNINEEQKEEKDASQGMLVETVAQEWETVDAEGDGHKDQQQEIADAENKTHAA